MAPEEKPRDDGLDSRQLPTGSARGSWHGSKPIAGRLSEIPPSVRKYPIPFFAISGLVAGFVLSYGCMGRVKATVRAVFLLDI